MLCHLFSVFPFFLFLLRSFHFPLTAPVVHGCCCPPCFSIDKVTFLSQRHCQHCQVILPPVPFDFFQTHFDSVESRRRWHVLSTSFLQRYMPLYNILLYQVVQTLDCHIHLPITMLTKSTVFPVVNLKCAFSCSSVLFAVCHDAAEHQIYLGTILNTSPRVKRRTIFVTLFASTSIFRLSLNKPLGCHMSPLGLRW